MRGREDTTCQASVLAISPHNSNQAFLSLTYHPAPSPGPRHSPSGLTYDTLLTSCDGTAISAGRLPQLRGAVPVSAAWLGAREIAVGCADGACHIITLRRVALKDRRGVTTLQISAAAKLAVELGRELGGDPICSLQVLEGGEGGDACESLLSGKSSSVEGGEDGVRSVMLATRGALVWYAGYGSFGKVLRAEDAAASGRVVAEAEAGEQPWAPAVELY